jgi:hypothetical protein
MGKFRAFKFLFFFAIIVMSLLPTLRSFSCSLFMLHKHQGDNTLLFVLLFLLLLLLSLLSSRMKIKKCAVESKTLLRFSYRVV